MKKIYLLAAVALGVFTAASCTKEMNTAEDGLAVKVAFELDDAAKAYMDDNVGFSFVQGDVINWTSASGNAEQTVATEDKNPTITVTIPGLATGDVTGYFSNNVAGKVDFEGNQTLWEAGRINGDHVHLASKNITLTKGTTNLKATVGFVGGLIEFLPYSATYTSEKVIKVTVASGSKFAGQATYDPATGKCTVTPTRSDITATLLNYYQVPAAKAKGLFVAVPDVKIANPVFTVITDKAKYVFKSSKDVTVPSNTVHKLNLNLDKATSRSEIIAITPANISSNDPMQYKSAGIGANEYGLGGSPDWWSDIFSVAGAINMRQAKYGIAENLFDADPATSYHLNLDWGKPGTSWGAREDLVPGTEQRYIQIALPGAYDKIFMSFQNSDSGQMAAGYQIMVSTNGTTFSNYGSPLNAGVFGDKFEVEISNNGTKAIRIANTKADCNYTCIEKAFGIAELELLSSGGFTPVPTTPTVTLDKPSLSIKKGNTATLVATVKPDSAPDKSVSWSTSAPSVATVSNGTVTAVAEGSATITVTCNDGGATATCNVTVTGDTPAPVGGEIDLSKATITTNAEMTYVSEGLDADEYGMGGNPDWFNNLASTKADARKNTFGLVSNLYDNDATTSYHTNTDWGTPYSSWGNRSEVMVGNHYIEVALPLSAKEYKIQLTADNCPDGKFTGTGSLKVYIKPNGGVYAEAGTYDLSAGGTVTIESIKNASFCTKLKFERVGNPDWTGCAQSFGFSEMKIWAVGDVSDPESGDTPGPTPGPTPPSHEVVPISAPAAPAGYTEVDLSQCVISTNNPMQYVSYGFTCDGDWAHNRQIAPDETALRQELYDKTSNLYDNDMATSYHTNFDIYVANESWTTRANALVPLNYIMVELPEEVSKICVWTVNPINGCYWGYTIVGDHKHAYAEINLSLDGKNWGCAMPYGEVITIPNSTDGTEFKGTDMYASTGTKIKYVKFAPHVGETSFGTFGQQAGCFGFCELRIWAM